MSTIAVRNYGSHDRNGWLKEEIRPEVQSLYDDSDEDRDYPDYISDTGAVELHFHSSRSEKRTEKKGRNDDIHKHDTDHQKPKHSSSKKSPPHLKQKEVHFSKERRHYSNTEFFENINEVLKICHRVLGGAYNIDQKIEQIYQKSSETRNKNHRSEGRYASHRYEKDSPSSRKQQNVKTDDDNNTKKQDRNLEYLAKRFSWGYGESMLNRLRLLLGFLQSPEKTDCILRDFPISQQQGLDNTIREVITLIFTVLGHIGEGFDRPAPPGFDVRKNKDDHLKALKAPGYAWQELSSDLCNSIALQNLVTELMAARSYRVGLMQRANGFAQASSQPVSFA